MTATYPRKPSKKMVSSPGCMVKIQPSKEHVNLQFQNTQKLSVDTPCVSGHRRDIWGCALAFEGIISKILA